jgi:hypothetical protein
MTLSRVNQLPGLQRQYAQGSPNSGSSQWNGPETKERFTWGPSLSGLRFDHSDYAFDKNGKLSPDATGADARAYDPYVIFRTAVSYKNHLRFSLMEERTKFHSGISHEKTTGFVPGTSGEHTSARMFFRYGSGRFHVGTDSRASYDRLESAPLGNSPSSVMYALLTTPPSFDNSNAFPAKTAFRNRESFTLENGLPRSYSPGVVDNPYWTLNRNPAQSGRKQLMPSIFAGYRVREWLEAKTIISGHISADDLLLGVDLFSAAEPDGFYVRRNGKNFTGDVNTMLNASKEFFNGNLKLDADLGLIFSEASRKIFRSAGREMLKPGLFTRGNVAIERQNEIERAQRNRRFYSRLNLIFKEISADLTSVREATSTLDRNIHSHGAGLSYNFGELDAIRDLNTFDLGRVFLSTARIQREAPLFLDPNSFSRSINDLSSDRYVPEWIPYTRTALKPESVASWEGGMEMEFFQGRVGVTTSWFRHLTRDGYIPLRDGEEFTLRNGARIENRGLEVDLNLVPARGDLHWVTNFRFTRSRSRVLSLSGGVDRVALAGFDEISSVIQAGQPYGVLVGTRYLRDAEGRRVIGPDGYPLVDAMPGVIGNPNPDWMLGIDNVVAFKQFELGFLFDIRYGGVMWNGTRAAMNYFGTGAETEAGREITGYVFDGVTESDEPNTVPVDFANPANSLAGNRWVRYGIAGVAEESIEDASWLRLRNLSLRYRFPERFISPLKIRNASVALTATNLLLFTKYSGIDPDTNLTGDTNGRGLDYFNFPNTKSYGVVLAIGF